MKVSSYVHNGNIIFNNFIVVKRSDNHYGVYEKSIHDKPLMDSEITHGVTLHDACKKAKLLQIGYDMGKSCYIF